MITIDSRIGSRELLPLFPSGRAQLGTLTYGDFSFIGKGPDGPIMVGIERKTVPDLLQSLNSDRLIGHQLPGLINVYHRVYLMIEGQVRPNRSDHVLQWHYHGKWEAIGHVRRPIMYRDFIGRLHTFTEMAGIRVVHTDSQNGTVQHIMALHHWWSKEWSEHHSMQAIYEPKPVTMTKPTLKRRFANLIPGIGWEKSEAVANHFQSVADMVEARPEEWQQIDGIGKGIAHKAYAVLHEKM